MHIHVCAIRFLLRFVVKIIIKAFCFESRIRNLGNFNVHEMIGKLPTLRRGLFLTCTGLRGPLMR